MINNKNFNIKKGKIMSDNKIAYIFFLVFFFFGVFALVFIYVFVSFSLCV